MWSTEGKQRTGRMVLAEGGYAEERRGRSGKKLSSSMAMIMGALITLEIMVAGAMVFNFDFHGADMIALVFGFMVLYFGVVAVLTDK